MPTLRTAEEIGLAFHAAQARRARLTANEIQRLWAQMDRRNLTASWNSSVGPRVIRALTAGQLASAAAADEYVDAVAEAEGAAPERVARVRPQGFAGVAADGRALESLMYLPLITSKTRIAAGQSVDDALMAGLRQALRIGSSEVTQAGRGAVGASMAGARTIQGYVRVVQPPACSRCIILAGKEYGWNKGFQRHPKCFPAGVVVSGPKSLAAARRWYEGELVVLATASGQELPVTGNHPVLTDRGWVPANLIQEGDHVVRSVFSEGAVPLVVPDENQVPARIEDLWRPSGVVPLLQMPTSAEDFHGDGGHGDVDVVLADGLLGRWGEFPMGEPLGELALTLGVVGASALARQRAPFETFEAPFRASDGFVSGCGLGGALLGAHLGGAYSSRLGMASAHDPAFGESALDDIPAHAVALGESELAGSGGVGVDHFVDRDSRESGVLRWDPAGSYGSPEGVASYASRGSSLRDRLAGQVELDRVVELRRVHWSGHVYNLTSAEGWYSANGLIVSNCDCIHLPTTLIARGRGRQRQGFIDPHAYFGSLSRAEQDRVFTAAGARAIREGGDINAIVNARRGMYTTTSGLRATREGTSRRGEFYRSERRRDVQAGRVRPDIGRGYSLTTARLLPEEIFELAGSRDQAIAMLRRFGYMG
ncbi:hypothetical protein ACIA74_14000 [Streptomyces sp. NPDC051658]|uniref:hypothetical protein n=1 Tax=Streptomyces sp. NPDC051658 TaxID=3365667 RepID=UPI0037A89A18